MDLSPNPFLRSTRPHGRTQLNNYAVFRQEVETRHGQSRRFGVGAVERRVVGWVALALFPRQNQPRKSRRNTATYRASVQPQVAGLQGLHTSRPRQKLTQTVRSPSLRWIFHDKLYWCITNSKKATQPRIYVLRSLRNFI